MNETADKVRVERTPTANLKRRNVLKVIKSVLRDAQREIGSDRVVGIFGLVIKEDGTASLVSAVTLQEMRVVMKGIPAAMNRVASELVKAGAPEH